MSRTVSPIDPHRSNLRRRILAALCGRVLTLCLILSGMTPTEAIAQPVDLCTENGGTAYCIGAEVGPFAYQVSDGNIAVGQGSSQASATAAYNQGFVNYMVPCNYTATNDLPPFGTASPGGGNAYAGNYTQALYYGIGQYWVTAWTLSAETNSQIIPIVYSGTHWPSSCQTPFGPFGVYVQRVRTVACPGQYVGPYRPNSGTTPTDAYCYRPATTPDPPKNLGPCCGGGGDDGRMVSNPINAGTGNKYQAETDYSGSGPTPLKFVRYYNSGLWNQNYAPDTSVGLWSSLGSNWRSTYDRTVRYGTSASFPTAYVYRPDGRTLYFKLVNGQFVSDVDIADRLVELTDSHGNLTGWSFTVADNEDVEVYDLNGVLLSITSRSGVVQSLAYDSSNRLQTVTDSFGRQLSFSYDTNNHLSTMTDPAGGVYTYAYNTTGYPYTTAAILTSVQAPGNTTRTYVYNESANTGGQSLYYALTGIVDEATARFATFQYDTSSRAVTSQHAGGVDNYTFSFGSGQTVITDPLGTARTYGFSTLSGVTRTTSINTPCNVGCGGAAAALAYDANSNISSRTDFNGNITTRVFDLTRNLETSRTEAAGTPRARTITTTWNPSYRLPALITQADRTTGFGYDASGNLLTRTVTETATGVTRVWTYTYDSYGRMLTADGPRTDVVDKTTYAYYTCTTGYQCGMLHTLTDALGHVTTYNTYNAHGQPLTITDPNNVVTTLTYDARQRLSSRQVSTETTGFTYWPTGLLKQVTLPDSSYILYTYDGAHRLIQINDELGNKTVFTLDAAGNRTAENTYDASSNLHRTHSRVISALNQVYQDVNAAGTAAVTTTFGYDNNGNQTSIAAPMARNTANTYDELNRLNQITDPASGLTDFAYDAEDNLTSVIDPRHLTTSYTYTGFGDLKTQASPDTATTTNTYDSGGNLATSTDARGAVSTYAYDVLNRVTSVAYKIGSTTDQTITFSYDAGTNGIGRLTGASDANHTLSWTYDVLGRVTGKGQVVGTVTRSVGYGYTNGNLTSLVTPSGQTILYGYNGNHQVTSITVNGTTVLNGVTYEPFGGANKWTWGNTAITTRTYDLDQKITQISSQGVRTNTYDNAFRITQITNTTAGASTYTYGYDLLDRVTSGVGSVNQTFTYDANGNRLTVGGGASSTYTISPTSNRITSISGSQSRSYTYDTAGNALTYSPVSLTYNDRSRLKTVQTTLNTETLVYNALGQMVKVSGGAPGTVLYAYDEAGHLLGEYSSTGALIEETVWLGDIPVSTLRPHSGGGIDIYYVHTDHLNTPHLVTDSTSLNKQRWRWFPPAFGDSAPNTNPANAGVFLYNLRYPGQVFDSQAGLHQNGFRDYDPAVGRYVESDPIGLKGGINTYGYVYQSPLAYVDPDGQIILDLHSFGCALLQIQVGIVCKGTKRRCDAGDSCDELQRKTNLHLTCAIAQSRLTALCFPNEPSHQQRITDALQGARRCLAFYVSKCSNCPAPTASPNSAPAPE